MQLVDMVTSIQLIQCQGNTQLVVMGTSIQSPMVTNNWLLWKQSIPVTMVTGIVPIWGGRWAWFSMSTGFSFIV